MTKYAVTGATGKLGRLVLDELLEQANPGDIVALSVIPSTKRPFAVGGRERTTASITAVPFSTN